MNSASTPNELPTPVLFKALPAVVLALALASIMSGCGVRQFGAKFFNLVPTQSENVTAYGPFFSSGQGGGSMSATSCATGAAHPCARARASIGMPFQFDVNPNGGQGPITAGNSYGAPAPYAGVAGAGRIQGSAGKPALGNRDLGLMKRQTAAGQQTF